MELPIMTLYTLVSFCPEEWQSGYSVNLVKKIPNPLTLPYWKEWRFEGSGISSDEGASKNHLELFPSSVG